ncbi:MAG: sulfite exporter TauE/SafE family protein [Chitinophagales bacterium]|nr:sulfite exporter TauE/SafE family protein [Chitinophagales bacterium]
MEIIGYIASLFIGISLGLIGGGGSILTVPVLVYLTGIQPIVATAYSLFIVGLTSLIGGINYYRKNLVSLKMAVIFGVPSIAAVYSVRKFVVPAIPDNIFTIGNFVMTKNISVMVLFAVLMIAASISMIKSKECVDCPKEASNVKFNYSLILLEGIIVGSLTGLVGAGGGFLIIPALVLLGKLDMKLAVGTSLFIIAAKSLIGFLGDLGHLEIDWKFLFIFSALSVAGIFIGSFLATKVEAQKLKKAFGWFVLAMGIFILGKELFML